MKHLRDAVDRVLPEAVAMWQELHRHPELSGQEYQTTEKIRGFLATLPDFRILPLATEVETGAVQRLMDPVEYACSKGLMLLPGIEISCETTAEDCHIVCLGCDWEDPFFTELEQAVQSRAVHQSGSIWWAGKLSTDSGRIS